MADEITLLQEAMEGNAAAFEQIVIKYQSLVCAITFSGCGRVDISEDLAQETFLNAWKNLRQLKKLSDFRGWLCTIARNMVYNHYRKKKSISVDPADFESISDENPTASEELITQEEILMLEQAMSKIPAEYREPLVMYYRQGKSTREVAIALEMNESTVRTRLHRGRELLREEMAERLERTLEKTAPDRRFTKAVMVAIGGLTIGMSAGSAEAAATVDAAGTGASTGMGAVISTVTGKIITAAAMVAVTVGVVFIYKQLSKPEQLSPRPDDTAVTYTGQEPAAVPGIPVIPSPDLPDRATIDPMIPLDIEATAIGGYETNVRPAVLSLTAKLPGSPDYVFEPNGVLSGVITDAKTGEPVIDAEVQLSISQTYIANTDENGFYSFKTIDQSGNYRIAIHSLAYLGIADKDQATIELDMNGSATQHFKLDRACMVDVWVVDEDDSPVKGARVFANSLREEWPREIGNMRYQQSTDENGYILLGEFPPSELPYLITVMHNRKETVSETDGVRLVKNVPIYAYAKDKIVLDNPDIIRSTEIVLEKGISVTGYAEYLDGTPAGGVEVAAFPDWWHSNHRPAFWAVDPNGFFTIDHIIPGTYDLHIKIPISESNWVSSHLVTKDLPLADGQILQVTVPEKSPQSLGSICGSIQLVGDQIPDLISIEVYSGVNLMQSVDLERDRQGHLETTFCINRLEPGFYRVQFAGPDIEPVTVENIQAPCDDLEAELYVIEMPRLAGTVVDAKTLEPITDFRIRARKLRMHRGLNYGLQNRWTDFRETNGSFELGIRTPGIYQVQAASEGFAAIWSTEINTDENEAVVIKLDKGGVISGVVTNAESQPVEHAAVIPLSLAGGIEIDTINTFVSTDGAVKTDAKGRFVLSYLAAGTETLKVTHPDYTNRIIGGIPVRVNQTTQADPIILGKGAVIEGYVYDTAGRPEPGVTLFFEDNSGYSTGVDEGVGRLGVAMTDPNGFYRVVNIPETLCYIKRQTETSSLGVVRRTVVPQIGKTSRIDFGGKGKLTGQVIIEGRPLGNTRLLLAPAGQPYFGTFRAYTTTDENGNFSLYPGISGTYTLYYKAAPSEDWKVLAVFTLSPDQNIDAGVIPKKTSSLLLYVNQPEEGPEWKIESVTIQTGVKEYAANTVTALAPKTQGDPYIVAGLLPGVYTAMLYRSDRLEYYISVHISDDHPAHEVFVQLPPVTSNLHVTAAQDFPYLRLISGDETMQMMIGPENGRTFKADNLPAEHFQIVYGNPANQNIALAELELNAHEDKTLILPDVIDMSGSMSALRVQVVDENGCPVSECRVWLESDKGIIEPSMLSGFQSVLRAFPGDYTIHTSRPGYNDVNMPITINPIDREAVSNLNPKTLLLRLEKQ